MSKVIAVVGIDPGAQGCICFLAPGLPPSVIRLKSYKPKELQLVLKNTIALFHFLFGDGEIKVYKERVGAMGERDKRRMARFAQFMRNDGVVIHAVASQGLDITLVEPQTWLRTFSLFGLASIYEARGFSKSLAKSRAKADYKKKACEIFNDPKITLDQADGMLIAVYGYIREFGTWNGRVQF